MFHLVAAALPGGLLTVGLGWRPLGPGVLALAPFVASLSALLAHVLGQLRQRDLDPVVDVDGVDVG
ncbi:hypothetical protein ACFPYM_18295, partial [Methylobacterium hispanicum]